MLAIFEPLGQREVKGAGLGIARQHLRGQRVEPALIALQEQARRQLSQRVLIARIYLTRLLQVLPGRLQVAGDNVAVGAQAKGGRQIGVHAQGTLGELLRGLHLELLQRRQPLSY